MNISQIRKFDVANGPGVRTTFFVSGCTHYCKGCFNKETWDFNSGDPLTNELADKIVEYAKSDKVVGVSILGGEPFMQNKDIDMLYILSRLKFEVGKPIWVWTGFEFNDLLKDNYAKVMLTYIDVLIDGRFEEDKKDLSLKYRGSTNQRVIDVKATVENKKIITIL